MRADNECPIDLCDLRIRINDDVEMEKTTIDEVISVLFTCVLVIPILVAFVFTEIEQCFF